VEYLTPERRARIHELVGGYDNVEVTQDGIEITTRGVASDSRRLSFVAQRMAAVADALLSEAGAGGTPAPKARTPGLALRSGGQATEGAQGESQADAEALVETATHLDGGPEDKEEPSPDEPRDSGLGGDIEEQPPEERDGESVTIDSVCRDLFGPGRDPLAAPRRFEELHRGRPVRGSGRLAAIERSTFDIIFGFEEHARARLEVDCPESPWRRLSIAHAYLCLPAGDMDALKTLVGSEVAFEGTIVDCHIAECAVFVGAARIVSK
jgi:hypothetical protein